MFVICLFILIALSPFMVWMLRFLFWGNYRYVFWFSLVIVSVCAICTAVIFLLDFPYLLKGGERINTKVVVVSNESPYAPRPPRFIYINVHADNDREYWSIGSLRAYPLMRNLQELIIRDGSFTLSSEEILKNQSNIFILPHSKVVLRIEGEYEGVKTTVFNCNDFDRESISIYLFTALFFGSFVTICLKNTANL